MKYRLLWGFGHGLVFGRGRRCRDEGGCERDETKVWSVKGTDQAIELAVNMSI